MKLQVVNTLASMVTLRAVPLCIALVLCHSPDEVKVGRSIAFVTKLESVASGEGIWGGSRGAELGGGGGGGRGGGGGLGWPGGGPTRGELGGEFGGGGLGGGGLGGCGSGVGRFSTLR